MNRIASAGVGAGAFVLLAGVAAGGYALRPTTTVRVPGPTVTVTATATRPVPGPTHTVTVTQTRTASPLGGSTTPCLESNGSVVPAVGGAVGNLPVQTCTMTLLPDVPAADGDRLVLTAPDGTSVSYQLGSPQLQTARGADRASAADPKQADPARSRTSEFASAIRSGRRTVVLLQAA